MRAITVIPGITPPRIVNRPKPFISSHDEVELQILQVGICHTDDDLLAGYYGRVPTEFSDLVIGHEMLGQVVEVGSSVTALKVGDYVVSTVRRSCQHCEPCKANRPDICCTGKYLSRGITGLDGFQCEWVVDKEHYLIHVPSNLSHIGVLTEPCAVVEKALLDACSVAGARLSHKPTSSVWLTGKRCLIAGLGTIGLLAAMLLRLRGAEVFGIDILPHNHIRPRWLTHIGGHYLDGRSLSPEQIHTTTGSIDLIFEAAGVITLETRLIHALARNGIYVLIGLPNEDQMADRLDAFLIRRIILYNQTILGSVNASQIHFRMAVRDLEQAFLLWGDHIAGLITARHPVEDFGIALTRSRENDIKTVVDWLR
jgi:glucose 1-dehydrogenase